MGKIKNKKVIVAMSGGVDSSVAAALLEKQGFDVAGVFMKFWPQYYSRAEYGVKTQNRCCSTDAEKRARLVAKKLGIPFYVFNFEKEFKKRIVDYFLKAHKTGVTPNPCVVCNRKIKFGLLLGKTLKLGADYIATGHYARIKTSTLVNASAGRQNSKLKTYKLYKGKDKNKDQSYFLWQLNQKQLKHILFPVGDYTKDEVRKLAKKFNLPTANTPESMEICFIRTTINEFLKKSLSTRSGLVVNKDKKTIGRHNGLYFYTIGQRKGLKILGGQTSQNLRGGLSSFGLVVGKPFYVLDKDVKKNLLIVTQNEKDLLKKELSVKNVNWISNSKPKLPLRVTVKIRYRNEGISATIKRQRGKIKAVFSKPQRAITPGQSAVFYSSVRSSQAQESKGEEILGGGIIV